MTAASAGGLQVIVNERGRVSKSIAGVTSDDASGGTLTVSKPTGATVRGVYFFTATTGFTSSRLTSPVTIDGQVVPLENETASSIQSWNYWSNVTSMVQSKINAAPAGSISFNVVEGNPGLTEGEIMTVIYDDPGQAADQTVTLLFGALATTGDQYQISLVRPISLSDTATRLEMSLGISYSYQSGGSQQYSVIDVNGARLSTAAGGEDDGKSHNGALLTVGGEGDSITNPPNPYATPTNPRSDDELYDLRPFVKEGDTSIQVKTVNPSNDDNVFFAAFTMNPPVSSINTGASADLATTKTGPANIVPGSNATYMISVKNNGPSDAALPVLSDPIPAGTTFISETHPAGWTCIDPAVGAASPPPLKCTAPTLALNATAYFTLSVHVNPSAAGTSVTNTATASSTTEDPNLTNNSASASSIVTCDHNIMTGVPGTLSLSGGTWCLTNITVGGSVLISPATKVIINHSTIVGYIQATNPSGFSVCNSGLSSVNISGATGFILIGDPGDDVCAGNHLSGGLVLKSNSAGVEVSHNIVAGGTTVTNNAGGGPFLPDDTAPELEANQFKGSLMCSGNTPPPTNDGQPNTVFGARLGQCASPTPL